MPKPPKPTSELDQSKAGLQDDHDARDPAQQQNDQPKRDQPNRDVPPDGDTQGGVGSQGGM